MRITSFIFCLFFFIEAAAQPAENPFIKNREFQSFISSYKSKNRNDTHTARLLFKKVHAKFLKNYRAYSQAEDVFKGNFDCLTGIYFLATSFEQLGFNFKIIETNYHIFMILKTKQGDVLLESTDHIHGFVTDKNEIDKRLEIYKNSASGKQLYLSSIHLFNEVLPSQLPGLLFFNQSVDSFHKKNLNKACAQLEIAWRIYENPRITEFIPILIRALNSSNINEAEKTNLISRLEAHQKGYLANTLASR